MKKCKSCKVEIDDKATKCPHCQTDQRGFFKKHPILTVIGILIVIGIIGSANGKKSPSTTTGTPQAVETKANSPSATPTPAPVADKMDYKDIVGAFDKNKLAAEKDLKGKLVEFSGTIKNISKDVLDNPFLSLEPVNAGKYYLGTSLACYFPKDADLTALENGKTVKVQGTIDGMTLGIVSVKNCSVIK